MLAQRQSEPSEALIQRVRQLVGFGLGLDEILETVQDADPDVVRLAWVAARMLSARRADWFDDLSRTQQEQYVEDHPRTTKNTTKTDGDWKADEGEKPKGPTKPNELLPPELRLKVARGAPGSGREVGLSRQELSTLLDKGTFALVSAGRNPNDPGDQGLSDEEVRERHEELRRKLVESGYAFTGVVGQYGAPEDSFLVMVHEPDRAEVQALGRELHQDSVIFADAGQNQMIFTTGENAEKGLCARGAGWEEKPEADDYFTRFPHEGGGETKFSLNIDFDDPVPCDEAMPIAAQRQDEPHGTEERRRQPEERFKDRTLDFDQVSDDFLDGNWSREIGYDVTHDRAQDLPEPESSQMTRAGASAGRRLDDRYEFQGLKISIENAAGSTRHWEDPHSGESGDTEMKYDYGYIRMTEGTDGDHVDVYIGPNRYADTVWVVYQMKKPDFKQYDEQKCMLGFDSEEEARAAYLQHYNDERFLGRIFKMPFDDFKREVLGTRENGGRVHPKKSAAVALLRLIADETAPESTPDGGVKSTQSSEPAEDDQKPEYEVGDEVQLKKTLMGLRKNDKGEVVGVQGYMIGVLFPEHPQAALWLDKDLLKKAPKKKDGPGSGGSGGGGERDPKAVQDAVEKFPGPGEKAEPASPAPAPAPAPVQEAPATPTPEPTTPAPAEPKSALLSLVADWFDDLSPEQQQQYVEDHPGTTKQPSGSTEQPAEPPADAPGTPAKPEIQPKPLPSGVSLDDFKLTVEGENAQEIADRLRVAVQKSSDLCHVTPPVCHQNLGIPRAQMPQLSKAVGDAFIEELKRQGIKVEEGVEHVGNIRATQREIDAKKVAGMVEAVGAGQYAPQDDPFIVSRDGYILDGHHRWASLLLLDPDNRMKVRKVDMDARDLVDAANAFEGVEQRGFGAALARISLLRRIMPVDIEPLTIVTYPVRRAS